jgi:trk system potassium uptake protein TrkA
VLRRAGAQDADMLIACAALDETNLVACKVAHDVFMCPPPLPGCARPSSGRRAAGKTGFSVDHVICPEESVMRYMHSSSTTRKPCRCWSFRQGRAHA